MNEGIAPPRLLGGVTKFELGEGGMARVVVGGLEGEEESDVVEAEVMELDELAETS